MSGSRASLVAAFTTLVLGPTVHRSTRATMATTQGRNTRRRIVRHLNNADALVFVSRFLQETAQRIGHSVPNGHVILNGTSDEFSTGQVRARSPGEPLVVTSVGNSVHVKRADALVKIIGQIHENRRNVFFNTVGGGDYLLAIKREIAVHGLSNKVRLWGGVPHHDTPSVLDRSDLMLLPSRNKGWPTVVLEAHARGVPVVGSSNGGIPEAIGSGGVIVPEGPGFVTRLAEAVATIDFDAIDYAAMQERTRRHACAQLALAELEIYRKVTVKSE